jgi:hypothetical protein
MTLRSKKPRPLTREDKAYRDDRLFVIATEDTYAPEQYFDIFRDPRVHVRILPTEDGRSAPQHVLTRLDEYVKEFELTEDDERWLMLDTDHWVKPKHIANFNLVCAQATQKRFNLAHSNPCFEIWLLLHVTDLEAGDQFARADEVIQRLKDTLGGYNKRHIDPQHFSLESAAVAVRRAEKLDQPPGNRWPQKTGSHVYQIVKKLLPR